MVHMNVYAVHTTRADEVRPTEAIYSDEATACAHAAEMSTDHGIVAASVVRFALDRHGDRRNIAMFVGGQRQVLPHLSDDRRVHGGGRSRF